MIGTFLNRAYPPTRFRAVAPFRTLFIILLLAILSCLPALADESDKELGEVLSSAESLFKTMRARDYPGIWRVLTAASQGTILDEAGKAIVRGGGTEVSKEELRKDFEAGGPVASGYWYGFLAHFDPDIALERSKWERGRISGDRAEILLTYKGSEKPALLKLFREDGGWKAGLVETFWGRK